MQTNNISFKLKVTAKKFALFINVVLCYSKVERMKRCFNDAIHNDVKYFTATLSQPCGNRLDYITSLIELTDNITSSVCSASSWQEACPGSDLGLGRSSLLSVILLTNSFYIHN